MKKLRYALLILAAGSLALFAVNILGKAVFLNITIFNRTHVIAASQGVCHMASTTEDINAPPMDDMTEEFLAMTDMGFSELINWGMLRLTVENRLDSMTPLRFGLTRGDASYNYSAVEFPWLLIPLALFAALIVTRRIEKKPAHPTADSVPI